MSWKKGMYDQVMRGAVRVCFGDAVMGKKKEDCGFD